MISDANNVPRDSVIEVDVCIVGAGAAGITIAREFAGQAQSVCLLESGGHSFEPGAQSLNEGESGGVLSQPLNGIRLRGLGGTTAVWSGRCRPLDELDFDARDWVPNSGWPFAKSEMDPYYLRAHEVCELGPYDYDVASWEAATGTPRLPIEAGTVENAVFQNSPPTQFGVKYKPEIATAPNIQCFLHATVTGLDFAQDGARVKSARVGTLDGNTFRVVASKFVLALGGIENARFLLLADQEHPGRVGNAHDRVGRYFMEHPEQDPAYVVPESSTIDDTFVTRNLRCKEPDAVLIGFLTLTDETKKKEGLLNANVVMQRQESEGDPKQNGIGSLRYLAERIRNGEVPDEFGEHVSRIIRDADLIADGVYRRFTGEEPATLHEPTQPLHRELRARDRPRSRQPRDARRGPGCPGAEPLQGDLAARGTGPPNLPKNPRTGRSRARTNRLWPNEDRDRRGRLAMA